MNEIKTHSIIYLLIIFGFFVSIIYLYSYWSSFDINVFQYVSIQQVVTVSIYPLFLSFISIIIGYWYGTLKFNKGGRSKYSNIIEWSCFVTLAIFVILVEFMQFWYIVILFLSIEMARGINKKIPDDKIIINPAVTFFIILSLLAFPFLAFTLGKINAKQIKNGNGVRYVDTKYLNNIEFSNNQERVKYLGLNGDFYFFMSDDNKRVFISKTNLTPTLEVSQKEYKDKRADITKLYESLTQKNKKK